MSLIKKSFFNKYLLPGFVFQSVIIGGGYGTGRELVEYFLKFGPIGGLLGMLLITTVVWSVFLALTFEFSRLFRSFDYRTFFKRLLGPLWPSFDIIYVFYLIIVLAVLGSASGILLRDNFGVPYFVGVIIMLISVGYLTFKGTSIIEKFLSIWSFILYFVYALLLIFTIVKFGPTIKSSLSSSVIEPGWAISGFKYAFYNLANVVGVLFCLKHLESRKEAVTAGLLAGVIGIVPALLLYVSVLGYYPDIVSKELPSVYAFQSLGIPLFFVLFQIVLYGTLIETGTALIHAVNERVQSAQNARNKELPQAFRPIIASVFLLIALGISSFGLVNLIAKGYSAVSWGFLLVYLIPIATIGVYKIVRNGRKNRGEVSN
ncbi:MAG: hypothetical protein J7L04_02740 [Bacteroidales bacterium]|nr:hypothetical protein [Bacteroidales bacterium]